MSAIIGLLAATLVSTVVSAGLSYWSAKQNVQAQKDINAENVQAQKEVNTQNVENQAAINQQNINYSREFAQNGIQWRMADMEAAGLNPVMASGYSGSPSPSALSAPVQNAARQQAPSLDLSGVGSALNAMTNMMYASYFMNQRNDLMNQRNDISRQNSLDRNEVLNNLYRRKGAYAQASFGVNSAKQLNKAIDDKSWEKDWDRMLKELKRIK